MVFVERRCSERLRYDRRVKRAEIAVFLLSAAAIIVGALWR